MFVQRDHWHSAVDQLTQIAHHKVTLLSSILSNACAPRGRQSNVRHEPSSSKIQPTSCRRVKSGMGSPDWHLLVLEIPLRRLLLGDGNHVVSIIGMPGVSGNDPEDELRGGKNQKNQKCLASKEIRVVEKLETLYIFGHTSQGRQATDRPEERAVERGRR